MTQQRIEPPARVSPSSAFRETAFLALVAGTRLALSHLQAEARTARGGLLWIVASPAIYVGAFLTVRGVAFADVPTADSTHDPALIAIVGVLVFQSWFEAVDLQISTFNHNKAFLKHVGVDIRVFFVANFVRSSIMTLVRFTLALICIALVAWPLFGLLPAVGLLFFMILNNLNGHVLGYGLSPISALYHDVRMALSAVSIILLFASGAFGLPVFLLEGDTWWFFAVSPIACGIDVARAIALGTPLSLLWPFVFWLATFPILAWLAFSFVTTVRPIIAERL